jgi:hypothetical protein
MIRRTPFHSTLTTLLFLIGAMLVVFAADALPSSVAGHRLLRREMRFSALQHDPHGFVLRDSATPGSRRGRRYRHESGPGDATADSTLAHLKHWPHSVMIRDFGKENSGDH